MKGITIARSVLGVEVHFARSPELQKFSGASATMTTPNESGEETQGEKRQEEEKANRTKDQMDQKLELLGLDLVTCSNSVSFGAYSKL